MKNVSLVRGIKIDLIDLFTSTYERLFFMSVYMKKPRQYHFLYFCCYVINSKTHITYSNIKRITIVVGNLACIETGTLSVSERRTCINRP